ncbi:MAG: T9SS type A sorting domain-containing protein [Bacteroidales bacterium]|nr:T9SS type A sorting domain-containing protein [Bacteroidales bacterium]
MKRLLVLCILFYTLSSYSQITINNAISNSAYLSNPQEYLSKLSKEKIPTKVLLDLTLFDDEVFKYNGYDKVKNCFSNNWKSLYSNLKDSYIGGKTMFFDIDTLVSFNRLLEENNITPLMFLKFNCSYISLSSLQTGDFKEESNFLEEINVTSSSYETTDVFATTILNNYIYGDDIKFIVYKDLFFTDDTTDFSLAIDFGNGDGFVDINFNEFFSVSYSSVSEDVLVKVRLMNERDTIYSHCTFYRKGTSTIPQPDIIEKNSLLKSHPAELSDDRLFYYPEGELVPLYPNLPFLQDIVTRINSDIEYCFYFNPQNESGMLRKPLIFCDGFDPGNTKNYCKNTSDFDPKGMYETLNGDISINEENQHRPATNLIPKLHDLGYDIVFVNFLDGAGDIEHNADALRGFLNNVINTTFRDENTEEILMIGPSMAAVVTRFALARMEEKNEEHYVKQWLSFDGPHKGANVSPGFQWLIKYFTNLHLLNTLHKVDEFKDTYKILEEPAAKQMLLQNVITMESEEYICDHKLYQKGTNSSISAHPDFETFYSKMERLNSGKGYPSIVKRYCISNGGKSQRYDAGVEIVKFKIFRWTYAYAYAPHNEAGEFKIFDGHKQDNPFDFDGINDNDYCLYTTNQIGYDNAPGGGYAMNGILNQNENNKFSVGDFPQYRCFTFMPTPTVLGVEINRENVYKTWNEFAPSETPFDKWFGMEKNEEHIQITLETAQNIIIKSMLESDYKDFYYPYQRENDVVSQTVSNKVLFKGENMTFAGERNTFIIQDNAVVNIQAEKSICLKKGFKANKGSHVHAIVSPSLKSDCCTKYNRERESINYQQTLCLVNDIYDYSNSLPMIAQEYPVQIFPNPIMEYLIIKLDSSITGKYVVNSIDGSIVKTGHIGDGENIISFSSLKKGVYIISIFQNGNIIKKQKILKQ